VLANFVRVGSFVGARAEQQRAGKGESEEDAFHPLILVAESLIANRHRCFRRCYIPQYSMIEEAK
jgi:hypothetical protein